VSVILEVVGVDRDQFRRLKVSSNRYPPAEKYTTYLNERMEPVQLTERVSCGTTISVAIGITAATGTPVNK
jgi:hypothetical protein